MPSLLCLPLDQSLRNKNLHSVTKSFSCLQIGHTDFVSALAYLPPSPAYPSGAIASGSRDATVVIWDPTAATATQLHTLKGHQYQVSSLAVAPDGAVASGSLDKTIKLWRGGTCVETLEGHEAAVLSLLRLPNGHLVSGSGDRTVRVWEDGKCIHTIQAHDDSVR